MSSSTFTSAWRTSQDGMSFVSGWHPVPPASVSVGSVFLWSLACLPLLLASLLHSSLLLLWTSMESENLLQDLLCMETTSSLVLLSLVPTLSVLLLSYLGSGSLDGPLYNGGPFQLVVFHFLIGIWHTVVVSKNFLTVLVCVLGSVLHTLHDFSSIRCVLVYPFGQGSFSDAMPLGISGTFNFYVRVPSRAQHLDAPIPYAWSCRCIRWFSIQFWMCYFISYQRLLSKSTELRLQVRSEEGLTTSLPLTVTLVVWSSNIMFNNSRSLHFFLAAFPVVCIWFTAIDVSTAIQLEWFQL